MILHDRYTTLIAAASAQNTTPLQLLAQSAHLNSLIDALILEYQEMQQGFIDIGERAAVLSLMGYFAGAVHLAVGFGVGYWWAKRGR